MDMNFEKNASVKFEDYTKKFLQSDSDPATMEVVTRTNAVKSPTNSPETTKLVYTVKEVAQMLAISQRAAYNLCNSTTEFRVRGRCWSSWVPVTRLTLAIRNRSRCCSKHKDNLLCNHTLQSATRYTSFL